MQATKLHQHKRQPIAPVAKSANRSGAKPKPKAQKVKVKRKRDDAGPSLVKLTTVVNLKVTDPTTAPTKDWSTDDWLRYADAKHQIIVGVVNATKEGAKRLSPEFWHLGHALTELKNASEHGDFGGHLKLLGISNGTKIRAVGLFEAVADPKALEGVPIMKALRDYNIIRKALPGNPEVDPTNADDGGDGNDATAQPVEDAIRHLSDLTDLLAKMNADPQRINGERLKGIERQLEAHLTTVRAMLKPSVAAT